MWKGNAVAPALDYLTQGIRVGLGSDATRNDGFRMIDAAEACQRIAYRHAARRLFVRRGLALGERGARRVAPTPRCSATKSARLRCGKKADFLLLDCSGPEVRPLGFHLGGRALFRSR